MITNKTIFIIIMIIAGTIQVVHCAKAEEPTQEQTLLNKCVAVVDVLSEGIKGIKKNVLDTCSKGGTFEAVDSTGKIHKFYCSSVIEL